MKLIFPGTRAEIEEESPGHRYHTNLIIKYKNTSLIIDLGVKHSPELSGMINDFDAMLITHAHPDHYIWTKEKEDSVKIPVYLTKKTLNYSKNKPVNYEIIDIENEFIIKDIIIEAFSVIHSIRCPAVCFRIKANKNIIYAPDILDTEKSKDIVFKNIDILIADGSSINVNIARRKEGRLFGHAMVKTIVNWCKKYRIKKLFITHCGKQIVTGDKRDIERRIAGYAEDMVDWKIAHDGFEIEV